MQFRESPMFQRNLSSSSSGLKHKQSKKPAEAGILFDPADGDDTSMFFWNAELSPNCMILMAQKILLFIVITVRTLYPAE